MINYSKHLVSAGAVKFSMWAEPADSVNHNVNMNAAFLAVVTVVVTQKCSQWRVCHCLTSTHIMVCDTKPTVYYINL